MKRLRESGWSIFGVIAVGLIVFLAALSSGCQQLKAIPLFNPQARILNQAASAEELLIEIDNEVARARTDGLLTQAEINKTLAPSLNKAEVIIRSVRATAMGLPPTTAPSGTLEQAKQILLNVRAILESISSYSSHVKPSAMLLHSPNNCPADTKTSSQFTLCAAKAPLRESSNLPHIFIGEFGQSDSFASCASVLGHHVGEVVLLRSKEQMVGINARRSIASVKYEKSVGYFPVGQFVSHAVRKKYFSIETDYAVAIGISAPGPQDASVCIFWRTVANDARFNGDAIDCNPIAFTRAEFLIPTPLSIKRFLAHRANIVRLPARHDSLLKSGLCLGPHERFNVRGGPFILADG